MTENVLGGVKTISQDDVKAAVLNALNSLDAKADRGTAYVVQTGGTSSNWYRVWSDGFIEQGGKLASYTWNPTFTITLSKPFSNTDYVVTFGAGADKDAVNSFGITISSSSKFSLQTNYGSDRVYAVAFWYACGY